MIPVVILTGFLGSGKTTLLNRWLTLGAGRAPAGGRLAIVVNEFGDVGIDRDLLPDGVTRQVELAGGCVCCQLDEDLARTLTELAERDPGLELIVVETTGLADPLPIGWTLARSPLDRSVRLAAVVTVVDATMHLEHRRLGSALDAQVTGADLLIVSKLELAGGLDTPVVRELLEELSTQNPGSHLVCSPEDGPAELWALLADPPLEGGRVSLRPEGSHHHPHHHHPTHLFESIALPIQGTLDFEELTAALEALPSSVIRIKGIARIVDRSTGHDEVHEVAFHRVGARVSAEPLSGAREHRMVAIGHGLDADQLAACLDAAVIR